MGEGWGEGEIPLILTFSHQGRRDRCYPLSLDGRGLG